MANTDTINMNGKQYEWTYIESGMHGSVVFDDHRAHWKVLSGPNEGETGSDLYKARSIAKNIHYVMWREPKNDITVVLTIHEDRALVFATVVSPGHVEFDVARFC